jgi:hypothetical protein
MMQELSAKGDDLNDALGIDEIRPSGAIVPDMISWL